MASNKAEHTTSPLFACSSQLAILADNIAVNTWNFQIVVVNVKQNILVSPESKRLRTSEMICIAPVISDSLRSAFRFRSH